MMLALFEEAAAAAGQDESRASRAPIPAGGGEVQKTRGETPEARTIGSPPSRR
jgi:hypothetical protein